MMRHRALCSSFTVALLMLAMWTSPGAEKRQDTGARRLPNIVVAIADDWSYPHASVYGDRVAHAERRSIGPRGRGIHACLRRRAVVHALPGRAFERSGGPSIGRRRNLWGFLPRAHAVYPDLLEQRGYVVGFTGKGWGPGRFEPGGRARNPAGPQFKSFDQFLKSGPFCFWFGSTDPHRPYADGSGASLKRSAADVEVPGFLPDAPIVRGDLLDYYYEVERFDRDLGAIVDALARIGEMDNTIVIVTSDNGMPFPRAKATVYDGGVRVPLVIRWPGVSRSGLTVDALVSLADIAPTLLAGTGSVVPGR